MLVPFLKADGEIEVGTVLLVTAKTDTAHLLLKAHAVSFLKLINTCLPRGRSFMLERL